MDHADQFAYVGVFSSGLDKERDPDFETRNAAFLNNAAKVNAEIKKFWIVYGAADTDAEAAKDLNAELTKFGIHNEVKESPGGATWMNWRRWLADLLPQMFQ